MKRTKITFARALILSVLTAASAAACKRAAVPAADPGSGEAAARGEVSPGTVILTAEAQAGGGIAVEAARMEEVSPSVKALGDLEFDARRVAGIAARAAGRLERLFAYPGDRIKAGDVLAEIYSPDYLAAQAEVLQAAARAERLAGQPDEAAARSFLDAARRKLAPLGLTSAEIDALIASGQILPLLAVRAPIAGIVLESKALAGAAVAEGTDLFKLGDPSTLWGRVHLTEKDLASVRPGMAASIRTQAFAGRVFHGRLVLVGASMDASTRTVEGRIELPNADGALKPGMYIEALLLSNEHRSVLTVPAAAVLEFPSGRCVFVRTTPTAFVLRPVETGEAYDGRVEILAGLAAGEAVAATGGIILKSELMKAGLGD
ncbi:MAG: efflux RND transporter periplasmic adaptor subunit [Acidobacteriota bacterium]|nr:efflux RND transporter periplasmic adaptor subunit [Acidobacteriota bacterium]